MRAIAHLVLIGAVALTLTACAAGSPDAAQAVSGGPLSQFVLGLWHGVIAPVTLLIEVVHRYIPGLIPWSWRLYQGAGAGVPYDIGFYLGLAGGPGIVIWRRRA